MKLIYINYISTDYNPSSSYSIFCVCVSCHPLNTKCGWLAWNQETPVSILLQRKEAKTSFFVRSIILNHSRQGEGTNLLIVNLERKKHRLVTLLISKIYLKRYSAVSNFGFGLVAKFSAWQKQSICWLLLLNIKKNFIFLFYIQSKITQIH